MNEDISEDIQMSKVLAALPSGYNSFSTAWDSAPQGSRTMENLIQRLFGRG